MRLPLYDELTVREQGQARAELPAWAFFLIVGLAFIVTALLTPVPS